MAAVDSVIFPFRGSEIGGSHISSFTLAEVLQSDFGVQCTVLAPEGSLIIAEAGRRGLKVASTGEAPQHNNPPMMDPRKFAPRRALLQRVARGRTIVHANDLNTLKSWGAPARALGMPVVLHHRSMYRMWAPHNFAALALADAVVCISDATFANIASVRKRKVVKVYNPFSIDRSGERGAARAALLAEFRWPADARLVGFAGNFWFRKRPKYFLDVAARMAETDPSARFLMFGRAGDFTPEELVECAGALGLSGKVAFPGFRLPVEPNVQAMDLLIAPALGEPFGRTLIEAILLGTPLIAAAEAGHAEILNAWPGGRLFAPDASPEEAAKLALQALAAPQRFTLQPAERDELAIAFSARTHAEHILGIYAPLIEERAPSHA